MRDPQDHRSDQPPSLRADLKAKGKRRRERIAAIAQATEYPLRRRNDLLPTLLVEQVPVNDLVLPKRNVRRVEASHIREIAASIGALGVCNPLLLGTDDVIINGVVTFEAAKLLDLPTLPCIRIDHLNEAEQRLLRVAFNRLSERGVWDLGELKVEFEELIIEEMPIEISGFSGAEIEQIVLDDDPPAVERGPLAPEPGARAIAMDGDVFVLGDHKMACGDATDPEALASIMSSDEEAKFVFTDEPYNVRIADNVTRGAHREFAMASGEMSDEQFLAFNNAWMRPCLARLADGGLFATFIDWRGLRTVLTAATELGLSQINLIVWGKTNAGMGSLYRSHHELMPLFKKGRGRHVNNIDLGRNGRWRSNLWTYPGASSIGSDARRGLVDHPTVKPVAMLIDALLDITNRGDIVIDPFLGSGSTLIAAEKTGRRCRGIEIDPRYADLIVRRYESETGSEAILAATGESFAELTVRRGRENVKGEGTLPASGAATEPNSGESVPTADAQRPRLVIQKSRPSGRAGRSKPPDLRP